MARLTCSIDKGLAMMLRLRIRLIVPFFQATVVTISKLAIGILTPMPNMCYKQAKITETKLLRHLYFLGCS